MGSIDVSRYKDKKVFLKLKNGRQYSGKIISINKGDITILDKFKKNVTISRSQIELIEENRIKRQKRRSDFPISNLNLKNLGRAFR